MERTQTEKWAHILLCVVLGGLLGYLFLRFLLPIFLPFLIAWGIAACVTPISDRLARRLHLSRGFCAVVLLVLFLSLTAWLISLGVGRLIFELRQLFDRTVAEYGSIDAMLSVWLGNIEDLLERIGVTEGSGLSARLSDMLSALLSSLCSAIFSTLPTLAGSLLSGLPSFLLASVISIIAAFYFCADRQGVMRSAKAYLPRFARDALPRWRAEIHRVSLRYLRCYLLLMLLTLVILFVGFLALGLRYALLLAILSAVIDLLPVLGVGTVLLPWAAVMLIGGNYFLGVGLLILYAICTLAHQIAEPHLLGKSLGLHPLATVFATYVGWKLIGFLGLLLAPVLALLVKNALGAFFESPEGKD